MDNEFIIDFIFDIVLALVLAGISIRFSITSLRYIRSAWIAFLLAVSGSVAIWCSLALAAIFASAHVIRIWGGYYWEVTLGLPAACFLVVWALHRKFIQPSITHE
jgi:hypothetical protein